MWYSKQICRQLKGEKSKAQLICALASIIKPKGAKWMISAYVTGFWKTVPNHTTTEIHSIA